MYIETSPYTIYIPSSVSVYHAVGYTRIYNIIYILPRLESMARDLSSFQLTSAIRFTICHSCLADILFWKLSIRFRQFSKDILFDAGKEDIHT